jgi:hypothetical protein
LATAELAVAPRQHTVHAFFFAREFLTKTQHDCHPPPTLLSLFPRWKIKLKGHHFDTIEVTEAESQVVLNTLTELNFQEEFKE